LYNHGKQSFAASDLTPADLSHEDDGDEYDDSAYAGDDDGDVSSFFVTISDRDSGEKFVGQVSIEGSRWVEKTVSGNPPYKWPGGNYMSYLSPEDVMQWIRKDYSRGYDVEGPIYDRNEATASYESVDADLAALRTRAGISKKETVEEEQIDENRDIDLTHLSSADITAALRRNGKAGNVAAARYVGERDRQSIYRVRFVDGTTRNVSVSASRIRGETTIHADYWSFGDH